MLGSLFGVARRNPDTPDAEPDNSLRARIADVLATPHGERIERVPYGTRLGDLIRSLPHPDDPALDQPIETAPAPTPAAPLTANQDGEAVQCMLCDNPGKIRFPGGLPECEECYRK